MQKLTLILSIATIIFMSSCNKQKSIQYPQTATVDVEDDYFGHKILDPYRWLEDDNSEETKQWVEAQNKVTNNFLNKIPFKNKIKKRLQDVWAYERVSAPTQKGDYIFYYKHDGVKNHAILYVENKENNEERILIDPNSFSQDGTSSLATVSISEDGKLVAYAVSAGGSDWREIFVKNVDSGENLEDNIKWVKFSNISWDKNGFYYSRYNEPIEGAELSESNTFQKVFYHKLGTEQQQDVLIYENKDKPLQTYSATVCKDKKYLFINISESTSGNSVIFREINGKQEWQTLDSDIETDTYYISTLNGNFIFLTNTDAPRYKIVSVNPKSPTIEDWADLIPEANDVLKEATITKHKIIVHYMVDAESQVKVFDNKGKFFNKVELPTKSGSVSGIEDIDETDKIYFTFTSYTTPHQIIEYDANENSSSVYFKPDVDFNGDDYVTELIFIPAEDGAQVPLHIVYKKGTILNGESPTLLYGYGGFNIVYQPSFDVRLLPWLENGGIYVNAHIRGGGEYGEDWYRGGTKFYKQRVFDDFILSAEYLIKQGYTNPDKLAIMGGSNGGLLVGAVANQRPELFKVALPAVGVMDMLRYQYFTIGWAWAGDYGRSDDSEKMFSNLLKYSPLHNIPKGNKFPATLVFTADHDDRVVPAHSFKYAATLQNNYKGNNPVLIRIETNAGHGAGKPISMQIEEVADRWSFTLYNMGIKF